MSNKLDLVAIYINGSRHLVPSIKTLTYNDCVLLSGWDIGEGLNYTIEYRTSKNGTFVLFEGNFDCLHINHGMEISVKKIRL